MAARTCPNCGGGNLPQATFCQYCGSALGPASATSSPGSSLPSSGAPPPPPSWPASSPAPPPPPRKRRWGLILVGLVVGLLVVGAIAFLVIPTSPDIVVTGINFVSPDNACGLDGSTDVGFNTTSGTPVELTYGISGNNTTGNATSACTIHSVTTTTPGFGISGANVPLAIPANSTQLLSFSVNVPDSSFTGVLTLDIT